MKIVYIISAYKYPDQLVRLVLKLNSENNIFFIHLDARSSRKVYSSAVSQLKHLSNVYFLERHACHWGDFGHVKATLKGIGEIFNKNIQFDYLILLTGQDYPIKSNSYINNFLKDNNGKIFMSYEDYRVPPNKDWVSSGVDRIQYYHFTLSTHFRLVLPPDLTANAYLRDKILQRNWLKLASEMYKVVLSWVPVKKRKFPNNLEAYKIYLGSSYWLMPKICVSHIYEFIRKNPDYTRFFKYVDIPDELFFQTIVLNSSLKDSVVNNNLFYIDWANPNPTYPRVFTKDDFNDLCHSQQLFARKFDQTRDQKVLDMIDDKILWA